MSMVTGLILGLVIGFVVGILVGRKNKQGVEKLYAEAMEEISTLKGKL